MTVEEFNGLVEDAYEAAFEFEGALTVVYQRAYFRQIEVSALTFETVTAAWTPPIIETLSYGMSEEEIREADRVRDEAASAIVAVFAAIGLVAVGREFAEAVSLRAQENFQQEILRNLRKIVADSFNSGLSSAETAAIIREKLPQVAPASAEMLAQTELTSMVNQQALAAANKQFPDGVMKTWLTVGDNVVRPAHRAVAGTSVPHDQPFNVGGFSMQYPGDLSAPLRLTARCRCRLSFTDAAVVASALEDNLMRVSNMMTTATTSANSFATITISTDDAADAAEDAVMEDGAKWRALLAVEGVPTEDGRMLAEGSLTWRDLPLSLMAMDETSEGGHLGAKVAGRIDTIWRDGNEVWGEGVFNTDEFGSHIQELVSNQSLRGNSIDPAVTAYEYRDAETGDVLDGDALMDAMMDERPILTVFLEAIIMASTVCSTPAIGDANIVLASGLLRTVWFQAQPEEDVLTASAAGMVPVHPPAAWFENPGFRELTPLTVTDDGRVMGHAAGWNTCHVGEPHGAGVCVTPPRSGMGYEVFHHGAVTTAEGHDVSVGHITMSTSHADAGLGWKAAQDHYDNSGAVVADVRAGEDQFGIWVSGALRPDLPAARVREMKAGSISGDWRSVIGRGLEFISALIVNIPGFPIPRPQASITASASGMDEVESLVAAGIVECDCVEGMSRREYLRKIRSFAA